MSNEQLERVAGHNSRGWRGPEDVSAALLRLSKLGPGDLIIDAGCGTGRAGIALRTAGWEGVLVGLDLNGGKLNIAAATGAYDQLIKCSLYEIPVPRSAATAVVSSVFTHGHVGAEAMRELHRVVRPGGLITVTLREDLIGQYEGAPTGSDRHSSWREFARAQPDQPMGQRRTDTATPHLIVTWHHDGSPS